MEKEVLDSIAVVQKAVNQLDQPSALTIGLDVVYKIAMILIASCNLFFAFFIFNSKNKKEDHLYEKNRKIGLLKSLVLDNNMKNLYDFFENVDTKVQALKRKSLSDDDKKMINDSIIESNKELRQKFIDTLIVINRELYDNILSSSDKLIDSLTETIFDEGINLSHQPMFEQKINKPITETKTSIIKTLFSYKGD